MRKAFVSGAAAFFAVSSFLFLPVGGQESGIQIAEAAGIRTADRELKKDKNYEPSDIYGRAHHIIYGGRKPHDDRVRIAVIINGDENVIVEDRVKNQIYSQLRTKFPRENFAVMKGTDVNTRLLQYAEEMYYDQRETAGTQENRYNAKHAADGANVSKSSKVDVDGMPVGMQPRGLADMQRMDYVRAGRECNYDYVFVLSFSNGKAIKYYHDFVLFETHTVEKNIWLCIRLVDVNTGDYVYCNDIVTKGKTHNGYINGRVIERSVQKAMQEAMDDISLDY